MWQALRDLAIDDPAPTEELEFLLDSPAKDLLMRSSIHQGMVAALAASVDPSLLPAEFHRRVEDARFTRLSSLHLLTRIDSALSPIGVAWAVLKGPAVASRYRRPELRTYNDLDVLVDGGRFGEAIDALVQVGFKDVNRNWGNYLRYGVAETPLIAPGTTLDLHWHVVGLERRRVGTSINPLEMLERRRTVSLGTLDIPTLDREDLLIHVALHAAQSGGTRLTWLRDIAELVRSDGPGWDVVERRVRDSGGGARIGQVLDRARWVVSAAVPESTVRSLTGATLLSARRTLDRFDRKLGLPSRFLRGLPVKMASDTVTRTVAAALRESRTRRAEPGWDAGDPASPLYWQTETGGPNTRAEYLEYVRQQWDALAKTTASRTGSAR